MMSASVPRMAASAMAALLSASAFRCSEGSTAVRKPPRQRLDTRSPASRIIRAALWVPTSATRSRQTPSAGIPARTAPLTASFRGQYLVVAVFSDSVAVDLPVDRATLDTRTLVYPRTDWAPATPATDLPGTLINGQNPVTHVKMRA